MDRPSRVRTALVVSADAAVRSDWADYFVAMGIRTRRCVGPEVQCAILGGGQYLCPLHDGADFAVYDRDSFTPEFRRRLRAAARPIPIAVARDSLNADGHHKPAVVEVIGPTPTRSSTG